MGVGIFRKFTVPNKQRCSLNPDRIILTFSTGKTDSASPVNEFTGAWIAAGTGTDEYLEVDMLKPWRFTAVHTQGQDGEAQWVKSYKIQYYDDENSTWVGYNDSSGQDVSIFKGFVIFLC